jgi:hypothetical protein
LHSWECEWKKLETDALCFTIYIFLEERQGQSLSRIAVRLRSTKMMRNKKCLFRCTLQLLVSCLVAKSFGKWHKMAKEKVDAVLRCFVLMQCIL